MKHRISWCLFIWLVSAFLVSVFIRDAMGVKIIAVAVAFISILATSKNLDRDWAYITED